MGDKQQGLPNSSAITPNARTGDANETYTRFRQYPSYTQRDETAGKTEAPNTWKASKPATTERGMIDVLRRLP